MLLEQNLKNHFFMRFLSNVNRIFHNDIKSDRELSGLSRNR